MRRGATRKRRERCDDVIRLLKTLGRFFGEQLFQQRDQFQRQLSGYVFEPGRCFEQMPSEFRSRGGITLTTKGWPTAEQEQQRASQTI